MGIGPGISMAMTQPQVRWPFARRDVFAPLDDEDHRLALIHSLPGMLVWPSLMIALAYGFQFAAGFLWVMLGGPMTLDALATVGFLAASLAYLTFAGLMWLRLERYDAHHRAFALLPVRRGDILAGILVLVFMLTLGSELTLLFHEFAMSNPDLTLSGGADRDDLSNVDDFAQSGAALWALILLTLIAAPLVEEILFRGWMLPMMIARGVPAFFAILISAFAFSTVHIAQGLLVMTSTFMLGVALGIARVATGRLAAPVIGHMLNNAWAVFAVPFILSRLPGLE